MLKQFSSIVFFIVLLASNPISAESGWTSTTQVIEITATTAGKFIIHATPEKNPTDCKDKERFFLDYSLPGANKIYLLLLDAAVSQLPVKLYITGRCELFGMSELSKASITFEQKS